MAINTYGLKINGIKAFAHETKDLTGRYGPYYHLSYNMATGDLLYNYFAGSPRSRVQYEDENVIEVGYVDEPMTMQAVADMIQRRVHEYRSIVAEAAE